eukprot:INCI12804.2.p1 GENE.INCI12804.2~~INCI12804.2.p1  ORF type:complete len:263 (-),score=34.25 INCI12804.2:87-812(-)
MGKSLQEAKRLLRTEIKRRMRFVDAETLAAQSQRIAQHVLHLPAVRHSSAVSIYLHLPKGEVRTGPDLIGGLLRAGKAVYVPKVDNVKDPESMRMLRLSGERPLAAFKRSRWGILEPTDAAAAAMEDSLAAGAVGRGVDLVVVPGMGFDRGLRRLGHGGGFYDSYIRRASEFMSNTALAEPASEAQVNGRAAPLPRGTRPYLVGLACPEQMLEKVPTGDWDQPLDCLVLPDEVRELSISGF